MFWRLTTLAATLAAALQDCPQEMCTGMYVPTCPSYNKKLASKSSVDDNLENVYFRNAAPHTVELLYVDHNGEEISHGLLSPGLRRGLITRHGDAWRSRAVRPGHSSDNRLLLEHRISAIEMKDCDCPQPEFVDCNKPPFKGPRNVPINDPVVFENRANMPVDVYYWNGTCEELITWDEVGGVQHSNRKRFLSTQGHNFRVRAAFSGRMLMQHTLSDIVIRGCEEDDERELEAQLYALQQETWSLEQERNSLREALAAELSRVLVGLQQLSSNATAADASRGSPQAISPNGGIHAFLAGRSDGLLSK